MRGRAFRSSARAVREDNTGSRGRRPRGRLPLTQPPGRAFRRLLSSQAVHRARGPRPPSSPVLLSPDPSRGLARPCLTRAPLWPAGGPDPCGGSEPPSQAPCLAAEEFRRLTLGCRIRVGVEAHLSDPVSSRKQQGRLRAAAQRWPSSDGSPAVRLGPDALSPFLPGSSLLVCEVNDGHGPGPTGWRQSLGGHRHACPGGTCPSAWRMPPPPSLVPSDLALEQFVGLGTRTQGTLLALDPQAPSRVRVGAAGRVCQGPQAVGRPAHCLSPQLVS